VQTDPELFTKGRVGAYPLKRGDVFYNNNSNHATLIVIQILPRIKKKHGLTGTELVRCGAHRYCAHRYCGVCDCIINRG